MGHTLEQFSAKCHDLLKAEPGPTGRRKVCALLQEVLKDQGFVSARTHHGKPDRLGELAEQPRPEPEIPAAARGRDEVLHRTDGQDENVSHGSPPPGKAGAQDGHEDRAHQKPP